MENKEGIIEKPITLPDTIEELIDFVIVGNEAIQSFKAKLRACNKSENAKLARDQALVDGRKVSFLVIEAESKLGELLEDRDKKIAYEGLTSTGGRKPDLPNGINHKESFYAQEIHRNPEIVERIWNEKTNDIITRHDILKAIKEKKREDKIEEQKEEIKKGLEEPIGLFDIIVIDPPWKFEGKYDAEGRRGTAPYPQMDYTEIMNIDIPARDDCILWLWTTHKDIWKAKEIMDCWNFDYKGLIVWDKEKMGIGTWLRLQCEFCLLGIKGNPLWEHKDIRDILREPRTQHSVKPEAFYKMIDDNFIGRKLDYFGRKKREGWEIYGAGQNSL